jgi:hypothetical protein
VAGMNGDGVAMNIEQTRELMNELGQVGATMRSELEEREAEILSYIARIGNKDIMGRAFREQLDPALEYLMTAAKLLANQVEHMPEAGHNIVDLYEAYGEQSAQSLRSLGRRG